MRRALFAPVQDSLAGAVACAGVGIGGGVPSSSSSTTTTTANHNNAAPVPGGGGGVLAGACGAAAAAVGRGSTTSTVVGKSTPIDIEVINDRDGSYKELRAAFVRTSDGTARELGGWRLGRFGDHYFLDDGASLQHNEHHVRSRSSGCHRRQFVQAVQGKFVKRSPPDVVISFRVNTPYQRIGTRGGCLRSRRPPARRTEIICPSCVC